MQEKESNRYDNDNHYKAIRDDYMTPPEIYEPLLKYFNRSEFDIDVCCTKYNIPAKQHFTKEIDGLQQLWQGLCFCNPPWKYTRLWLKKGAELVKTGADFVGCYVIPSDRLYVNYMQDYIINNPFAAFGILPGKQGYIIPGQEELPPVPSVGTMICILAANAPEIAAELNIFQTFKTTFFAGRELKSAIMQQDLFNAFRDLDQEVVNLAAYLFLADKQRRGYKDERV